MIPFHVAKAGLWTAQRDWLRTNGPAQRLACLTAEQIDRAESDLEAVEAALRDD